MARHKHQNQTGCCCCCWTQAALLRSRHCHRQFRGPTFDFQRLLARIASGPLLRVMTLFRESAIAHNGTGSTLRRLLIQRMNGVGDSRIDNAIPEPVLCLSLSLSLYRALRGHTLESLIVLAHWLPACSDVFYDAILCRRDHSWPATLNSMKGNASSGRGVAGNAIVALEANSISDHRQDKSGSSDSKHASALRL